MSLSIHCISLSASINFSLPLFARAYPSFIFSNLLLLCFWVQVARSSQEGSRSLSLVRDALTLGSNGLSLASVGLPEMRGALTLGSDGLREGRHALTLGSRALREMSGSFREMPRVFLPENGRKQAENAKNHRFLFIHHIF
jgi:hypothetical protein